MYATLQTTFGNPFSVIVGDTLLMVGFAEIDVQNGTFHQHAIGADVPPNSILFGGFPLLEYDTFGCMGLLADDPNMFSAPGTVMDATSITGSWFSLPGPMNHL